MLRYVVYIYTESDCTEIKSNSREKAIKWVNTAWENNDVTETIIHDDELHTIEYHQVRKQQEAK